MAQYQEKSEQFVVTLGVSTSQILLIALAAVSLLVLLALLWMNHRAPVALRPVVVLHQTGALCPVNQVSALSQDFPLPSSARAPPTFIAPSLSTNQPAQILAPDLNLMARPPRPVLDSAEKFR